MADYERSRAYDVQGRARPDAFAIDEGLRAYMLRIYNYMALGLVITAAAAYGVYAAAVVTDATGHVVGLTSFGHAVFASWLKWVLLFAPLAVVFLFSARINSMSASTAQGVFWLFSALMGASLSTIFLVYTHASIVQIFLITAAAFGGLSLWGYVTKRDLSGVGSFMFMGLIGIIIASLVNIFLHSSALQFAVSVLAVLIFAGLTAYDTQRLKDGYYANARAGGEVLARSAVMGALSLYLDFLNMFLALLQLFGDRR